VKASRYNRLFQAADGAWLAFNTWSTALAEIEPENLAFLRALLNDPEGTPCDTADKLQMREALVAGNFLIDDAMDEVGTVKADLLRDRFSLEQLHLTIAPTLDCNFRCDYCYEEHLRVNMSRPVVDATVRWTEQQLKRSDLLHVTWYGGEPLLPKSWDVVQRLSEQFLDLTKRTGKEYSAHIVTNGFLLDGARMGRLKELGVSLVQVTLDGPKESHDRRRFLVGGGGTYDRIVANLQQIVDQTHVQLRVNVDQRNLTAALDAVEHLAELGLAKKMRIYLAMVTADAQVCGNIQEMCYDTKDFAAAELEVYREAARRGLPLSKYPARMAGAFCSADRLHGYVLAPSGLIFKCWHEVTMRPDRAIGSVLDAQEPFQKLNEDYWLKWDALEKSGCRSCAVLPLCHGGCPLEAMEKKDPERGSCDTFRFNLEPLVELRYLAESGKLPGGNAAAARGSEG
jgi:uncharacterized protein